MDIAQVETKGVLLTKDVVEDTINHQFQYGFKTAVEDLSSKISRINDKYVLEYTPCRVSEKKWFGDCGADVLLTGKALMIGKKTIENQEYNFPEAGFSGNHYKLIFDKQIDGKRLYTPIDHSKFYKTLNIMHATEVVDTEFNDFENEELVGDVELTHLKNYEEFDLNGNPALTMIGIVENGSGFVLTVCIFEQDFRGNIVKRSELSTIEDNISIKTQRNFNKIHITKDGVGRFEEFADGIVKDKMFEARNSVISAYKRGENGPKIIA